MSKKSYLYLLGKIRLLTIDRCHRLNGESKVIFGLFYFLNRPNKDWTFSLRLKTFLTWRNWTWNKLKRRTGRICLLFSSRPATWYIISPSPVLLFLQWRTEFSCKYSHYSITRTHPRLLKAFTCKISIESCSRRRTERDIEISSC